MLLPQRGDPTFDWNLRSLKFPQNAVSHTLLSACSAANNALNSVSQNYFDPALKVGEPAIRAMVASCNALASQAASHPDRAKAFARLSIESVLHQMTPDATGAKPTLPFFASYPLFTSTLVRVLWRSISHNRSTHLLRLQLLVDSDRELCSRVSTELNRVNTPKTRWLAGIINNALATAPAADYLNYPPHHSSFASIDPYASIHNAQMQYSAPDSFAQSFYAQMDQLSVPHDAYAHDLGI